MTRTAEEALDALLHSKPVIVRSKKGWKPMVTDWNKPIQIQREHHEKPVPAAVVYKLGREDFGLYYFVVWDDLVHEDCKCGVIVRYDDVTVSNRPPEPVEAWTNLYRRSGGDLFCGGALYDTPDGAETHRCRTYTYLGPVLVYAEEGGERLEIKASKTS